ncbi:MAG: hypothetical protein IKB02_07735 [Clostridia bacterium]|nr:hypothetical protein [Clostridia bacterium]
MDNETKPRQDNERGEQKNNPKHYRKNNKRRNPHHNNRQGNQPNQNPKSGEEKVTAPIQQQNAAQGVDNAQQRQNNNKRRPNKHKKNHKPRPANENVVPRTKEEAVENTVSIELGDEALAFYDETKVEEPKEPVKDEVLVEIIGVRFKPGGKTYYFAPNGITAKKGDYVIVETARGLEYGKVAVANSMVGESEFVPPLRPVIRIATEEDIKHHDDNVIKQDEAAKICNEKIIAHNLDMKLIDVQYTFDNTKLLFYFTSSGRVDFRELVKDLASVFKTRIELRQIGIRDEAKLIGGLGVCGRPLCCSVFLTDFGQVSIKMAKDQNLSLNSLKISGACGRLMCCLKYEHDTYVQGIKNLPPIESTVRTPDGIGTVTEHMPLAEKLKVRLDDKPDQQPKTYSKDDVTPIQRQK